MSLFSRMDMKKHMHTMGYNIVLKRTGIPTHAATCTDTLNEISIHRQMLSGSTNTRHLV